MSDCVRDLRVADDDAHSSSRMNDDQTGPSKLKPSKNKRRKQSNDWYDAELRMLQIQMRKAGRLVHRFGTQETYRSLRSTYYHLCRKKRRAWLLSRMRVLEKTCSSEKHLMWPQIDKLLRLSSPPSPTPIDLNKLHDYYHSTFFLPGKPFDIKGCLEIQQQVQLSSPPRSPCPHRPQSPDSPHASHEPNQLTPPDQADLADANSPKCEVDPVHTTRADSQQWDTTEYVGYAEIDAMVKSVKKGKAAAWMGRY